MYWSYVNKIFLVISNGNRTEWSPIRATFTIRFLISEFARKTRRSQSVTALLTNMRTLKFKSRLHTQLRFSLPSIVTTITSNEPWNTETHKTDRNSPITNHKPCPFEPVNVKFCFLRGSLRWLTAPKNAIVSWLFNFRIRMFEKRNKIAKWILITCFSTADVRTKSVFIHFNNVFM